MSRFKMILEALGNRNSAQSRIGTQQRQAHAKNKQKSMVPRLQKSSKLMVSRLVKFPGIIMNTR